MLDQEGKEHHRTVGFLSPEELVPALLLGMAKTRFDQQQYAEALSVIQELLDTCPGSDAEPEALFLKGVSGYKSTHDPKPLKEAYERLRHNTLQVNGPKRPILTDCFEHDNRHRRTIADTFLMTGDVLIFYHSASGNTQWVAEKLAAILPPRVEQRGARGPHPRRWALRRLIQSVYTRCRRIAQRHGSASRREVT